MLTLALVSRRLSYPLPDAALRPLLAQRGAIDGLMKVAERRMRRKAAALAGRSKSGSRVAVGGHSAVVVRTAIASVARRDRLRFIATRVFVPKGDLAAWFGMGTAPFWVPVLHPVLILLVSARQAHGLARLVAWRISGHGLEAEARLLHWLDGG